MVRDDIYKITITDKRINTKKIVLLLLAIILLIGVIVVVKNSVKSIQKNIVYEKYEEQLAGLREQEKEKQVEANRQEEKQTKIPQLTQEGRDNMECIYHAENKRAFLTFDDGPSTVTPIILDILKQENIKATFFVLGSRVEAMPETVKRIYEEGHYVANHGYSHSYSKIYTSPQAVLDEFVQCNEAVKGAIGVPEYNSHLFRFPGGLVGGKYAQVKMEAKELLSQNEILYVDWNALTGDAETANPTVEFELERIKQTVAEKNSVVILMHDAQAKAVTAEALPQIIAWLKENGYEFKNFYEIIK